jgi:hypothetical protein
MYTAFVVVVTVAATLGLELIGLLVLASRNFKTTISLGRES